MVSDEDIIKALDSRDRRTQPVWTSKDFQDHFGVEQPTVLRWLSTGRSGGKKQGLVDQGKIRERKSGSTRYYTMPEDTMTRGVPTASSSNIGQVLQTYESFRGWCRKWSSILVSITVIYLLIRLTAEKPLVDEFSIWGFIVLCALFFGHGYVSNLFRSYNDPPSDWVTAFKRTINPISVVAWVVTAILIYSILIYFGRAELAVLGAVAVAVFEMASMTYAGRNGKVMFELTTKYLK
tara:strand:+ start:244 stop:951 length:708 start_codon:yes stop_codon:yes gene_type:complete